MSEIFNTGSLYKRSAIHEKYGGNGQSGISPSAKYPYIFIFSGSGGEQHGYKDQWENDYIYSYTGAGQAGDMEFVRGNLALRDHLKNGKRVFLFEYVKKAYVKFICELEFQDFGMFLAPDSSGTPREAIKFFFKRKGAYVPYDLHEVTMAANDVDPSYNRDLPNKTERAGLVLSRVGQGAYRKSIINRWENECAVTGYSNGKILIASHIVPWKDATDKERLDVDNGILLSPTYDALFDKYLITFTNIGTIDLSKELFSSPYQKIGVTGKERILKLRSDNIPYLQRHQEEFHKRNL